MISKTSEYVFKETNYKNNFLHKFSLSKYLFFAYQVGLEKGQH